MINSINDILDPLIGIVREADKAAGEDLKLIAVDMIREKMSKEVGNVSLFQNIGLFITSRVQDNETSQLIGSTLSEEKAARLDDQNQRLRMLKDQVLGMTGTELYGLIASVLGRTKVKTIEKRFENSKRTADQLERISRSENESSSVPTTTRYHLEK